MENTVQKQTDPYIDLANKVLGRIPGLGRSGMIQLRRSVGLTTDKLNASAKILFYSLFPADAQIPKDKYILNCILFGVQIACIQDGLLTGEKKIQDIIGDTYKDAKSKSMKNRIEALMSEDGRYNEMFFTDLSWLAQGLLKKKVVNVFSMTGDLINWDIYGRDRWIKSIVRIKQNEMM